MPQLDFSTFPPQLVWLAITFIVLYVILSTMALPAISRVVDARRSQIDGDLDKAASIKDEAAKLLADYERTLADAHDRARTELRKAADEIAAEATRRQAELGARMAEQVKAAESRIAQAKERALANLNAVAGEAAAAATERLIGRRIDRSQAEQAVEAARQGRA